MTDADVMRTVRATVERPRGARRVAAWADTINAAVLASLTLSGLLSPYGVLRWYQAFLVAFIGIAGALLGCAALITFISERQPQREQGPRRKPAPIWREIRETSVSAWVAACLLAWPLARVWSGNKIGLVWTLEEAGGPMVIVQTIGWVFVLDAWLYWKHRLLHTRLMFPFHRQHHSFRDPTAFAGFGVGPVEGLLTFWPIIILALPDAIHYAPLYFGLSAGFILLNLYLHCGVRLRAVEALLSPVYFNTSVYHNRHHADAEVNYAEAFTIWDHLCRTREQDVRGKRYQAPADRP